MSEGARDSSETLRRGFDDFFGLFDRDRVAALLAGWEERWPAGTTVRIVAECRKGRDDVWGIDAVEVSPAPRPARGDERLEVGPPQTLLELQTCSPGDASLTYGPRGSL